MVAIIRTTAEINQSTPTITYIHPKRGVSPLQFLLFFTKIDKCCTGGVQHRNERMRSVSERVIHTLAHICRHTLWMGPTEPLWNLAIISGVATTPNDEQFLRDTTTTKTTPATAWQCKNGKFRWATLENEVLSAMMMLLSLSLPCSCRQPSFAKETQPQTHRVQKL